jgi:hypothetical protein
MRSFLKEDDGILDLLVKVITIAAFGFAVHQYMYKIYPVWSKEKELLEVSQKLGQKQHNLNVVNADLSKAREALRDKEAQVENAKLQLKVVEQEKKQKELELNNEIQGLIGESEVLKREYAAEKLRISTELKVAKKSIETKNSRMVGVYLESFANDIFDIQMDNIRWSRGDEKLDLQRDIIKYSQEKIVSEKDPIKKTALQVFKLYAEKELNSGQKQYSQALMVSVFYQYDQDAKALIARLSNA